MSTRAVLVTIPFSHYCEKARWALDRAGIDYVEDGHVPVISRLAGLWQGGWNTVPMLRTADGLQRDSTAILEWVDRQKPELRLYPENAEDRAHVMLLEDQLDEGLGVQARIWALSYVFQKPALATRLAAHGVPRIEAVMAKLSFPVVKGMMKARYGMTAESEAASTARVEEGIRRASDLLEDRKYLFGEHFTAADLTLAALLAPVVLPKEFPVPMPEVQDFPEEARAKIEHWRGTAAGRHAMRMYSEERGTRD